MGGIALKNKSVLRTAAMAVTEHPDRRKGCLQIRNDRLEVKRDT